MIQRCHSLHFFFFYFFYFHDAWVWAQSLVLARQVLYNLTLISVLFEQSHIYAQTGLDHDPSIYSSSRVGMTLTHHRAQLLLSDICSLKFLAQSGLRTQCSWSPPSKYIGFQVSVTALSTFITLIQYSARFFSLINKVREINERKT
jgi:hypothetical protein